MRLDLTLLAGRMKLHSSSVGFIMHLTLAKGHKYSALGRRNIHT